MDTLSKELRDARKKKQLTQKELAQRLGIPQGHISSIEQGKIDIRTSTLIQMARVLDYEVMLIPRALIPLIKGIIEEKPDTDAVPRWQVDEEGI